MDTEIYLRNLNFCKTRATWNLNLLLEEIAYDTLISDQEKEVARAAVYIGASAIQRPEHARGKLKQGLLKGNAIHIKVITDSTALEKR